MTRRWLSLIAAQSLMRAFTRVAVIAALGAVAIVAAPVSAVAAGAFTVAWLAGWPPRRLLAAAAWCAPMTVVWLAGTAWAAPGWAAVADAPYRTWLAFWQLSLAGSVPAAAAGIAPLAVPLGLAAGSLAWSYRIRSVQSGAAGLSPAAVAAFDQRQWRHQSRTAKARLTAPSSVPLLLRDGLLPVGAVIRTVGHRAGPVAAIGYDRMRSHQIVVGTTGTGKTTLLLRLWAGFMAAGLHRQATARTRAPLLVVLDCKGGSDARKVADRFRRVLREAGARSTAVWPDDSSLALWDLPPRQLTTTLVDLIEHGAGGAAYYTDVMEALVGLAVEAPCGPPASAADLLARLEPGWLSLAYSAAGTPADHAAIRSAAGHLGDVALRYRTLFRRLGNGFDGPGGFADADAWYCILEGTDQVSLAESQARALVDLLANFALRAPARREILLAVDEFSAVSRRLPIWQLFERARSLGLAVQVSAQSWQGLGTTDDERHRIAATAEGGVWLLRTPEPEPLVALAGSRRVVQTTRMLVRFPVWAHQGSSRLRDEPVVDAGLIRRLEVGQVAYIYRGGVSYIQVKRLIAAPAAVPAAPVTPTPQVPGGLLGSAGGRAPGAAGPGSSAPSRPSDAAAPGAAPSGRPPSLPGIGTVLDPVFGPEPGP